MLDFSPVAANIWNKLVTFQTEELIAHLKLASPDFPTVFLPVEATKPLTLKKGF